MAKRDDIEKFISNPDGVSRDLSDYSKHTYDNDTSKFVREDGASSKTIKEQIKVEETQRVERTEKVKTPSADSSRVKKPSSDIVNNIFRKPNIAFSVSSAVAAVGSTAAAVAVTVAVAVVIVVATLSVTVSLVSATAYSLSFYVDISNEENKTFEATLSQGDTNIVYEMVRSDYLTFSDLIPDSEYNLRIVEKESGELYFEEKFFTLKNDVDRAQIEASFTADGILAFSINVLNLQRDEFYTVEVTDASGKRYFVKDDTVCPQSFELNLGEVDDAYIKISINGKYARLEKVSKVHIFGEPTFDWAETTDGWTATAVFADIIDATYTVQVPATVTSETTPATCEDAGKIVYTAEATFEDNNYSDTNTVTLSPLGHDYGDPEWDWQESADGGYTLVTATFVCANDPNHMQSLEADVTEQYTNPTCEDAGVMTYTATVTFLGQDYEDSKQIESGAPLGHEYGEPEWEWTEGAQDEEGIPNCTATAVFTCTHDPSHTMSLDAEVSHEGGAPGCEEEGHLIFYASAVYNEVDYQDEREVTAPALGHSYAPVFHWIGSNGSYEAEFYMMCKRQDNFLGPFEAQVTSTAGDGYTLFTATATYDDVEYSETKKEVDTIKPLAVGAKYFIGDKINMGGNTVYFYDDYAGGAHRTNMGNATPVVGMLPAGDSGGATLTFTDILDYDRIILNNDVYARMTDDEYGSYHGSSEETSWRFEAGQDTLVGVTIVSGSGTSEDPYMLAPIYGVSVTYNANGGMFNSIEDSNLTLYCEGQDSLAIPPAENPEASGMIFIGWFTDQLQENKFDFENTEITDDITLFAGWMSV